MTGMPGQEDLLGRFRAEGKLFVGSVCGNEVFEKDTDRMIDVIDGRAGETTRTHNIEELEILPPVDRPSKIICVGLNYRSHIKEMNFNVPKEPIIFTKPSSAIIGHGDRIVLPLMAGRVDYEGESAIIIGRRAKDSRNGWDNIFGFTGFNDVTARDLQEQDPDWTRAKGFDTFAPIGPLVSQRPPDRVTTRLNGIEVQKGRTSDRVFDDAALVEYISRIMTLEPGDVIATGTPAGIAPIKAGDIVEVDVDGVGTLRNQASFGEEECGGR